MHKEILQNGYKKLNNMKDTNKNDLSRQFTEEQIQVPDKHMKHAQSSQMLRKYELSEKKKKKEDHTYVPQRDMLAATPNIHPSKVQTAELADPEGPRTL